MHIAKMSTENELEVTLPLSFHGTKYPDSRGRCARLVMESAHTDTPHPKQFFHRVTTVAKSSCEAH